MFLFDRVYPFVNTLMLYLVLNHCRSLHLKLCNKGHLLKKRFHLHLIKCSTFIMLIKTFISLMSNLHYVKYLKKRITLGRPAGVRNEGGIGHLKYDIL